jgi:hypothetical protein
MFLLGTDRSLLGLVVNDYFTSELARAPLLHFSIIGGSGQSFPVRLYSTSENLVFGQV